MATVPGCCKHVSPVWDELKTAKSNKTSITAVWLDIANAYGSIHRQLIFYSLKCYGINPTWIDLLTSYCNGLWSKSFSTKATSGWQKHFRGIFTGCTVSIILFLAGMNVILEFIMAGISSSLSSQFTSPVVKAFMDDLFLMSPSLSKTQDLLNRASLALSWARMSVKASKSKSLVIDSGKIVHDKSLCIVLGANCQAIPSIADNPVKFWGRTISDALSDKYEADSLSLALTKGLALISNTGDRAVQKLWILQHLLVPRLRWPLLIYEIPISMVTKLEQKISCCIRKWLRLHKTTNIFLYSSSSPCPLPIKSLSSIMKSAKVSGQLLLQESADPYVSEAKVLLKSGNWSASEAVEEAKFQANFRLSPVP